MTEKVVCFTNDVRNTFPFVSVILAEFRQLAYPFIYRRPARFLLRTCERPRKLRMERAHEIDRGPSKKHCAVGRHLIKKNIWWQTDMGNINRYWRRSIPSFRSLDIVFRAMRTIWRFLLLSFDPDQAQEVVPAKQPDKKCGKCVYGWRLEIMILVQTHQNQSKEVW